MYFRKSYLRTTVGQTRLSIAIIDIERSHAKLIFQLLIDRIMDIFGKRKNAIFYEIGTNFNYFIIYWVKQIRSVALIMF